VAAQAKSQPVISVDTKKKELVGNFKNGGSDYRPKGDPLRVNVHDFEDKDLGKVVPYGVYDVTANTSFVSVGITSDTAEFAVQSIRHLASNCRRFGIKMPATALAISRNPFVNARRPAPKRGGSGRLVEQMLRRRCDTARPSFYRLWLNALKAQEKVKRLTGRRSPLRS
jgi:hypothetical protein